KSALCHTSLTSLMIVCRSHDHSIFPVFLGQRGFSIFLMVDQGRSNWEKPRTIDVFYGIFKKNRLELMGFAQTRPSRELNQEH
ncbi:MAG: hypothetical protein ACYDAI_02165, partial [Trichloromonadaceae bacterium]